MTPSEGKDSAAVTQEKHLFLFFDLFCRLFLFVCFPPCFLVVNFIGTKKPIKFFFSSSHNFYSCCKLTPLHWAFAVLWHFLLLLLSLSLSLLFILSFFFFLNLIKKYLNLLFFFSLHLFLCLPFLLLFPLAVNL